MEINWKFWKNNNEDDGQDEQMAQYGRAAAQGSRPTPRQVRQTEEKMFRAAKAEGLSDKDARRMARSYASGAKGE